MSSNKIKILVSAPIQFLPKLKKQMKENFDCDFSYKSSLKNTIELLKKNSYEAWLVSPCPTYRIDRLLFNYCPTLKIIATPST